MDISVIIPLYNEEESLPELHAWIQRVMNANGFTYEIIFINDIPAPIFRAVIDKYNFIREAIGIHHALNPRM